MKNIILLSDGTGNGAAKRHRTNVWRLYDALDFHKRNQIACYDDGVGSQEFIVFKLLGGAFGWGLKRNVLDLYTFLCRNYTSKKDYEEEAKRKGTQGENTDNAVPSESRAEEKDGKDYQDDKIYLFGFSRGAFTVRILADLIDKCGLCTPFQDNEDLRDKAERIFNSYRAGKNTGWLYQRYRKVRKIFADDAPCQDPGPTKPSIEFIGVWDTVDAYGFPVDEITELWDRFIFPIRFTNNDLPGMVKKACQALSIDDERHTFHPILWNEPGGEDPDRIEQVWFPGVHSDVGGGYPRNKLALVTLDWMITKVEGPGGLRFIPEVRRLYTTKSEWHGIQHDSRRGLAAYYRYKPRDIEQIGKTDGVRIDSIKIHNGVLERIEGNVVPYAPTGLPENYETVWTRRSSTGTRRVYETNADAQKRAAAMEAARDVIFMRRWLYGVLLAVTLVLLYSRFFLAWDQDGTCKETACLLDPVLQLAINMLPYFARGWIEALRQNPSWLWGFVGIYSVLLSLKVILLKKTQAKAAAAWVTLKSKNTPMATGVPPEYSPALINRLRKFACSEFIRRMKKIVVNLVFAGFLILLAMLAGRTVSHLRSVFGQLHQATEGATTLTASRTMEFNINRPAFASGNLSGKREKIPL
ncbi:DUF2235 domain-containing protein [Desulfogranum mediterraneum]|uniref:DUF2235 domain-containing protein n=1 Tax=Desulfogranum mediterraneum TaxID=160661 RepID=UPI000408E702|nr:DUF2235 domain-containing protein [Desulfogranum mediterraneum]